jgi:hypothetical protein
MRKVRDFDAELKALGDRAKLLRVRKIQQFGELIEATGADALEPDLLAGALLAAVAEKEGATTTAWTARGAQFFRETGRKSSRRTRGSSEGGKAAAGSAEPA